MLVVFDKPIETTFFQDPKIFGKFSFSGLAAQSWLMDVAAHHQAVDVLVGGGRTAVGSCERPCEDLIPMFGSAYICGD